MTLNPYDDEPLFLQESLSALGASSGAHSLYLVTLTGEKAGEELQMGEDNSLGYGRVFQQFPEEGQGRKDRLVRSRKHQGGEQGEHLNFETPTQTQHHRT